MRDIKAEVEAIRQLDPSAYSELEANEIMQSFMTDYLPGPNNLFMASTYRARPNEGQKLFCSKKELWAPPADKATRSRFNGAGEAVLYLAATPLGAIWEMRPAPGSWITILVGCQNHDSTPLGLASIGIEKFNDSANIFSSEFSGGVRSVPEFQELLKRRGIEQQWLDQDDFLCELTTKRYDVVSKSDHYKFTRPIRNRFISDPFSRSGLMYPSVASGLHSFNVALELDAAKCIDCVEAWVVDVRETHPLDVKGGEKAFFGPVIYQGKFDSDDNIQWGSRGEWHLESVRQQFLLSRDKPPTHEGLTPMAKKPS